MIAISNADADAAVRLLEYIVAEHRSDLNTRRREKARQAALLIKKIKSKTKTNQK